MIRLLALGLAAAVLAASLAPAIPIAEAAQKQRKSGQSGSPDSAATMTAIALAESGGNSKSRKKAVAGNKKPAAGTKPVPRYNLQNAWPAK